MIRHVIIWKLREELSEEEKADVKNGAKAALEALPGIVPGLVSLKIQTETLSSANADMMLDSCFESKEALEGYRVHPDHVAAANKFVRPFVHTRLCCDYDDET